MSLNKNARFRHSISLAATLLASMAGIMMGYISVTQGVLETTGMVEPANPSSAAFYGLFKFWLANAFFIGAAFGSAASGWLLDRAGRKRMLWLAGLTVILSNGWLCQPVGPMGYALGRFGQGLAVGIACVASPVYIAEIAPPWCRGALIGLFQLAVALGILLGYGGASHGPAQTLEFWNVATLAGGLLFFGVPLLPEPPVWLLAAGKGAQAKESLRKLRKVRKVKGELRTLGRLLAAQRSEFLSLFHTKGLRFLILGVLIAALQQATGINSVLYHAHAILEHVGFDRGEAGVISTYWIGVLNVGFTLVGLALLDSWGRRPLALVSVGLLVVALNMIDLVFLSPGLFGGKTGALAAIGLFVSAFAVGFGPILWVYAAELFPFTLRAKGASVMACVHWLTNGFLQAGLRSVEDGGRLFGAFWVYALLTAVAWIVFYVFLPETKHRPAEILLVRASRKASSPPAAVGQPQSTT